MNLRHGDEPVFYRDIYYKRFISRFINPNVQQTYDGLKVVFYTKIYFFEQAFFFMQWTNEFTFLNFIMKWYFQHLVYKGLGRVIWFR